MGLNIEWLTLVHNNNILMSANYSFFLTMVNHGHLLVIDISVDTGFDSSCILT